MAINPLTVITTGLSLIGTKMLQEKKQNVGLK